jgi:hypothetical protein
MKLLPLKTIYLILFLFTAFTGKPIDFNAESFLIEGKLIDKETGESLIGATIYVEEFKTGTATDINGNFILKLPNGTYNLKISYIGYKTLLEVIQVSGSFKKVIYLEKDTKRLEDVVITAEKRGDNITRTEMSVQKMKIQEIRRIPAFMGEVDIIKAIQLLPGVQSTSEGTSGFSVRGGNMDQNLILLDDAHIYNASHFMGFFSVFNNDAIKEIELYKGDIPVAYGGRLSSLLDIKVNEGNNERWKGSGGFGPITTRLSVNGPLVKDKTTVFLAGRLFNAKLYLMLMQNFDDQLKGINLYFYDVNAKISHRIDNQNNISLNFYNGKDVFDQQMFEFGFGNTAGSVSWLHSYSEDLASKLTLIYSKYGYNTGAQFNDTSGMSWNSNIRDYGFRIDNTVMLDAQNTIKFGLSSIYHRFYPGLIEPVGETLLFNKYELAQNSAIEWGVYGSNIQKVTEKITLKYGIRFSIYQNVGAGTIYNYDASYQVVDSSVYSKGSVYNVYQGLEPRIGLVYQLNDKSSIKASYSRTRQYVHMASRSAGGTPFDIWISSNPNIKPQIADQGAVGYFRNFWFNQLETSVELYYKQMNNTIDFKDHAQVFLNNKLDGELRIGDSYAYGAEFQVKFNFDKLTGWVSYTLSKSIRDIPGVNGGVQYNSPYDKPNDIAIIGNYELNQRWSLSANWVYASGTPMTVPSGFYTIDNVTQLYYKTGDRNTARMPDYHRLDLGLTYKSMEKPGKRVRSEWNFSVYNAYARHNPWAINYVRDEKTQEIKAEMTYLFSIIPSVTYNITF